MPHATNRTARVDARMRAAWQAQLVAAPKTAGLLPDLGRRRQELLPRFAAVYTQLRALPRRMRRILQRRWKQSLASLALWLALGQSPALAATITVGVNPDTAGPTGPSVSSGVITVCTLIDAITAANTDSATGGCPAGSGADTIILPATSTQTLTRVNNDTYGPTGLPVISSQITIEGQGSTIVREASAPEFRILAIGDTGDLTLNETTVSGGAVPATESFPRNTGGGVFNAGALAITNSTITGNSAFSFGGGIANYGKTLTVTNSTISGNTGGGVANGLYNTLTITNSTISGNEGSGMLNVGIATVTQSTISGNSAGFGGGIRNGEGTLTIMSSTISGNTALRGGGVANDFDGALTIMDCTISDNTANGGGAASDFGLGGGVLNNAFSTLILMNSTISGNSAYQGGGVANYYYSGLTITTSTISGNTADDWGGGVLNSRGSLIMQGNTITGNSANIGGGVRSYGGLALAHTLISGNTAPTGAEIWHIDFPSYYEPFVPNNYNLFGLNGDAGIAGLFSPGPTDIVPGPGVQLSDILDPTLADNGGPTLTHNLVPGSPAIDAIPAANPDCGGTDQRGVPRPQGAGCDIGAVEFTEEVGPRTVTIDIRPGLPANRLPLSSPEFSKPVAILSSETFDALTVDPATVRFGATGTEAAPRHVGRDDVSGDGRPDLILRFTLGETGIECGDTEAILTGETFEGQLIEGSDAIKTVQCP